MMSQRATNYAKILLWLRIPEESVRKAIQLLVESKELSDALKNPAIKRKEKEAVIDRLFERQVQSFIKVLCAEQCIGIAGDILREYDTLYLASKDMIRAKLSFVTELDHSEQEQMKDMICKKYNKAGVELELSEDASLIGGFCLTVGDTQYDRSIRGTLKELEKALVRR